MCGFCYEKVIIDTGHSCDFWKGKWVNMGVLLIQFYLQNIMQLTMTVALHVDWSSMVYSHAESLDLFFFLSWLLFNCSSSFFLYFFYKELITIIFAKINKSPLSNKTPKHQPLVDPESDQHQFAPNNITAQYFSEKRLWELIKISPNTKYFDLSSNSLK